MRNTTKYPFRSLISLLLAFCLVLSIAPATALTAWAAENEEEEKPIVYVSVGDSMTNGYCLDGYDGTSGGINYGSATYSNKFAAWLAGYTGSIKDNQVIFEGSNGIVDHRQLAVSAMRGQDVQWILELDYEDDALMESVVNNYSNGVSWSSIEATWYNTWGFTGDRNTYNELCDNDYRLADAAARILTVYNAQSGNGYGYYATSPEFLIDGAVDSAVAGVAADPYFPSSSNVSQIGGYKYLQIAAEFYQKSIIDADIISLAVGNTNFGTQMLTNIVDVVMSNDMDFSTDYNIDRINALVAADPFVQSKVNAMLNSSAYAKAEAVCVELANGDAAKANEIKYIVKYCMTAFIAGYIGMLEEILELNPDADIIMLPMMNAYEGQNGEIVEGTLGELVDIIYTPVNSFLKSLPAELMASMSEEKQAKYADANFYLAESTHVSCMVDIFGDDFYVEADEYPGLLNGTEGYTANTNSIVRARFVEEIVCGDMLFNAMGLKKANNQTNVQNFLNGGAIINTDGTEAYNGCGVIAYDKMTATEKAAYAAQNAAAAKEYALYLAFENTLIRCGTEDVTIEALANLSSIFDVFAKFQGPMMAQIEVQRAQYYANAAVIVAASSNGALTEEQVVAMMNAADQVKAQVWAAYADYHEALATSTGHTILEELLYCDTCSSGAHGDLANMILATYAEQMDLLPYTIIAQQAEEQTGGLLDGNDIKRLCEAEDYEAEVYQLVAEKSDGQMTAAQVEMLKEEDGVWNVAGEISGNSAALVKMAYENNMLDAEQMEQIETLMRVQEAVIALLENEATFVNGASGIVSAIDGASQLAYLLAIPQTMSDEFYNDEKMRGAFCMNARCVLGTGAGGHPSVAGHNSLYKAVLNAYDNVTYQWSEDYTSCTATHACAYGTPDTAAATVKADVSSELSCTTAGSAIYTATFDVPWAETQTKSVEAEALGHHWDKGVITREPSQNRPGIRTFTCTRCGETRTKEVPYGAADSSITRIYGEGRVETAIAVADMLKDTLNKDSFDAIIIDDGNNFADALTGSYLAAVKEAPILLYQENAYELNEEYIQNNLSKNGTVYILGGESAVPADAETSLKNLGFNVIRLQGSTRFETNLAILDEAGVSDQEILICNGWNYADALSASATGLPILLVNTNTGELTAEQTEFLAAHKNNDYTIIGGAAAVSEELEAKIDAQVGDVARVYGETREATSIAVAECFFSEPDMVLVAYSRNFPDGLCGGPLAYALKAPLLLVSPNNETGAAKYINENLIISGHILGGSAVISDELVRSTFDLSADTVILAD